MKIIIDQSQRDDIVLKEILEPNSVMYVISQNDRNIVLTEYQLDQLVRAAKMLIRYE